ncbi:hypothetical protein EJ05DRAFT_475735 [Pseudovirgaria hyperparasitica]|uniref:Uncharacterized protein n=1 Tax=Pseudovirgaria hyperparasitica TaxID=470096 RepID=A0A6A6W667_9PEZI|nr:uncharacterized protein EJ05DRAFT_475735 [Pseudovirgaria hyperparasitica]KAF2758418.1 hypothetical protein EJ05DRAFT_475735 [Pseudovirgaria hyperparasitica]
MSASRNGEGAYTRISETTYGEEDVEEGFYPVTITAGVDKVLAAESAQTETRFTLTGLPTLAPTQNTDGQSEPTTNVPVAPTPTSTGAAAAVTFVQGGMVAGVAAAMAALAL